MHPSPNILLCTLLTHYASCAILPWISKDIALDKRKIVISWWHIYSVCWFPSLAPGSRFWNPSIDSLGWQTSSHWAWDNLRLLFSTLKQHSRKKCKNLNRTYLYPLPILIRHVPHRYKMFNNRSQDWCPENLKNTPQFVYWNSFYFLIFPISWVFNIHPLCSCLVSKSVIYCWIHSRANA